MQVSAEGYLMDCQDWNRAWAIEQAKMQHLLLNDFDWRVIDFVRQFYSEIGVMPLTRKIIRFIREQLDANFDSLQLQQRYTDKPLRVIALIAGLPKPIQCI